ncbi:MAG: hypothetical protein ACK5PP_09945 [Acidimicrobiales bacterium]
MIKAFTILPPERFPAARSGRAVVSLVVAAGLGATVFLSGCASRPSEGDLADAILSATADDPAVDVSEDTARCIARQLLDSDLSDTTLEGLAENFDAPQVLETELDRVEPVVTQAAAACQIEGS